MTSDPRLGPQNVIESFERYVKHGIPTGGFLRAVLENDLMGAVGRADRNNGPLLPHICAYVYSCMPEDCWGSPAIVTKWLESGRREPAEIKEF